MPTTFDEETCKTLIGQELSGSIQKVECEEYQHEIPETGEIITLSHHWEYVAQEMAVVRDFTKVYEPSTNDGIVQMNLKCSSRIRGVFSQSLKASSVKTCKI